MGLLKTQTLIEWLQRDVIPFVRGLDNDQTAMYEAVVGELEEYRLSLTKRVSDAVHLAPNMLIQDGHAVVVSAQGRVIFIGRASEILGRIFEEGATINLSPSNYQLINRKLNETQKGLPVPID